MKNVSKKLTKEYDALERAKEKMIEFEQKYNIKSIEIYNKTCNMNIFSGNDKYLWEAYIRDFIKCSGKNNFYKNSP